tara:strand:- start:2720 stop:3865 length:1146 start_codon:yes stop_codon:yes gene_type:complete
MNYNQLIIDSVYKFEEYDCTKYFGKRNKYITYLKYRYLIIKSLMRMGNYYIPSKTKYNVDQQLISDAQKLIDPKLEHISRSCLLTVELQKNFNRVNLRYGYKCLELIAAFLKDFYSDKSFPYNLKGFQFINALAPIIHFPNDYIESGNLHYDRNLQEGKTITAWIPFTEYKYPGMVTKEKIYRILGFYFGEKISNFIFKRVKDIPLRKSPFNAGEWMAWNDTFIHQGMINSSDKLAIAFMVRFSNKLFGQPCLPIGKLIKIKPTDNEKLLIEENKALINYAKNISMVFIDQINNTNEEGINSFIREIEKSNFIENTMKNLNSIKEEIFVLHISHFIISSTWNKVKNYKIESKNKNNFLLEKFFKMSSQYLKLKISNYFNEE